jgi:glycosyltransferase involved in cell wall biosynthesis
MGNFMTKRDYEIDVVILTKNSNKPWSKRVLTAIKKEIPVHHFIVVDGYSTDGTIEIVRELFDRKIVVIKTLSPLGCARYNEKEFEELIKNLSYECRSLWESHVDKMLYCYSRGIREEST